MFAAEFNGLNSLLVETAQMLVKYARPVTRRNYTCYELPEPVLLKITNPRSRIITIAERGGNKYLPYIESLWLASGRNDLASVEHYVPNLRNFSDDDLTLRAAYGPRFRRFNNLSEDYKELGEQKYTIDKKFIVVDQFQFIEDSFKRDSHTRQAIITLGDPIKDCYDLTTRVLKETKDFPCTRSIQFIRSEDKLDVIVHMRSNDFIWGASGVNIFNFTFLQEYFASILGLEVGSYYHIANNLHYYDRHKELVTRLARVTDYVDEGYVYPATFSSLSEFDNNLKKLSLYEANLRNGKSNEKLIFEDEFFDDWSSVIFHSFNKSEPTISFHNPILKKLFNKK